MTTTYRPTLLNSCGRAATAAEARFRIDTPVDLHRVTRVIALDPGAVDTLDLIAELAYRDAHLLAVQHSGSPSDDLDDGPDAELVLRDMSGSRVHLDSELEDADSVVMIATMRTVPSAARTIGEACALRGIMTAGLVFGDPNEVRATVNALRPYARVLLVSLDRDDLSAVLSALRA